MESSPVHIKMQIETQPFPDGWDAKMGKAVFMKSLIKRGESLHLQLKAISNPLTNLLQHILQHLGKVAEKNIFHAARRYLAPSISLENHLPSPSADAYLTLIFNPSLSHQGRTYSGDSILHPLFLSTPVPSHSSPRSGSSEEPARNWG
ncbi:hypothetical protein CEXT_503851 [Caerostris extrusa]|uniref:Uncharacterized protein n=1 Tax=Caerostris extrusa TaxID=172846 RepID=A0AAV4VV68_CAEEX|nr:hypothetical protein CEXT_503851 [Caerostris extrusa]